MEEIIEVDEEFDETVFDLDDHPEPPNDPIVMNHHDTDDSWINPRSILEYFESGKEPRECQVESLLEIEKQIRSGKRTLVVRGGTGSGKSLVAMCVARWLGYSYYATPSKILQKQYRKDFPDVPILVGQGNFKCHVIPYEKYTTDKGPCKKKIMPSCSQKNVLSQDPKYSECYKLCPYLQHLEEGLSNSHTIMNYHNCFYLGKNILNKRNLITYDEAHELEGIFSSFISTDFRGVQFPELDFSKIDRNSKAILSQILDSCNQKIAYYAALDVLSDAECDALDKFEKKVEVLRHLIAEPISNLVMWNSENQQKNTWDFHIKPLFIAEFIADYIKKLAYVQMFFSATINYKEFLFSSGFTDEETCFIDMDAKFNPENAPILDYFKSYAEDLGEGINNGNLFQALPQMVGAIETWCEDFPNQRILIHTHSGRIEEYMKSNINLPNRQLLFGSNYDDKESMLQDFKNSESAVLFSYSCYQGVDLPDDVSRLIFFCKIPYLPITDPYITARKNYVDPDGAKNNYYSWETCLRIIQGSARHIRNKDDYGLTVFFDNISRFVNWNFTLFPPDFIKRMQVTDESILAMGERINEYEQEQIWNS